MSRRRRRKTGAPEGAERPADTAASGPARSLPVSSDVDPEAIIDAPSAPVAEPPVVEPAPSVAPRRGTDLPRARRTPEPADVVEDSGPPSTVPGFLQPYLYPSSGDRHERPQMSGTGPTRPMHASSTPDFDIDESARSDLQDKLIGEILRVTNQLGTAQIDQILAHQAEHKKKFGEAAVALGLVERDDVLWALSQQFQYAYAPGDAEDRLSDELVVARQPFSDAAEVFREMRTQLLMNVLDGSSRRALSVVSAGVGEGKTFFAANLAIAFSQLGARTLLIDADMRTPRLHKLFAIEGANGLSAVLSGRAQASVIRPIASLPSLYLLPVGAAPPNPSELVQRPSFAMMIKGALRSFEHVIVDTPAAQHGPDARVIASRCGAALAIGRKHRTPLGKLQTLIEQVSKNTERFAGVVMNDF